MKTVIDLDDDLLALAARELGTNGKKETVHAALEFAAHRRQRAARLLAGPLGIGVGPDIIDPDVMAEARR